MHPRFIDGLSAYGTHSRRRGLGCIPMNEPFPNCECHHMDKDVIMFIPDWLHQSINHSVKTERNMETINDIVYEWFNSTISKPN